MSKPDKPETPEHEKTVMRHQARLGKEGNQLAHRVGSRFVSNMKKDRMTKARGRGSADVAIRSREAMKKTGNNVVRQAKGSSSISSIAGNHMVSTGTTAVTETGSRKSQGARQSLDLSGNLTRGGLNIARIQQQDAMYKMDREFKRANEIVDLAGVAAAYAVQTPSGPRPTNNATMSTVSDGAYMSALTDMDDPLSAPLQPI